MAEIVEEILNNQSRGCIISIFTPTDSDKYYMRKYCASIDCNGMHLILKDDKNNDLSISISIGNIKLLNKEELFENSILLDFLTEDNIRYEMYIADSFYSSDMRIKRHN
ncbi:hypothetical protein SAMN05443270_3091 [Lacrimispora sphenoides]|uniref:hypothetical protein n=1 Tax=Lacrimispora sphenoides TaxID=29370 RepID=UPI0008B73711|nr:hypothetical protein [Lacrimispora sphenoides]SEU09418.1 hypothetical protein SAMN05443270_3091 [Lacrimispora sphenoides]